MAAACESKVDTVVSRVVVTAIRQRHLDRREDNHTKRHQNNRPTFPALWTSEARKSAGGHGSAGGRDEAGESDLLGLELGAGLGDAHHSAGIVQYRGSIIGVGNGQGEGQVGVATGG